MKKLLAVVLAIPLVLILVVVLGFGIAIQQGIATKADIGFLIDLGKRDGLGAVYATIRAALYGVDPADVADASYGREQVAGRGHAPWVLRGNLDGRPRVLEFALAPGLWAAYDTQQQSLYQVWQGEVLFEGAVYDYRHGPQPVSQGAWFQRDTTGAQWFLTVDGQELPAQVHYMGHEYGAGRKTAAMRFALTAGAYSVEMTEQPELVERDGQRFLTRTFHRVNDTPNIAVAFRGGDGERHAAEGTLEIALQNSTPIPAAKEDSLTSAPAAVDKTAGKSVIANSDCMGCHAETHRVTGPAFAQIAGKFQGQAKEEVVAALAQKVLHGSVNTWGPVPMPAHPQLTEAQAKAAVTYILSVDAQEANLDVPLDSAGHPYVATLAYDVLPRLRSLHPSFTLENLAPKGFQPKVGGLGVRGDGKIVVASWDADGAVFLVDPAAPEASRVRRIAEGLHEPLGLTVVDNRIFVLQKQELTELIDTDGDGIIDRYRTVSYDWPSSANFHSFAFGLQRKDNAFYYLLSICILPGGASCPDQLPTQGKLLRVTDDGKASIVASGFRTPNGIATGPGGDLYVTDNQGDWLPSSKLIHIKEGGFYGSRAVHDEGVMQRKEDAPTVWLPQDEVGNSPTQPLMLTEGPYKGQMIFGDVYNGGVKRVFLEQVNGQQQGAAFHFSAGFQGAVNRLLRMPDNSIVAGEIGNPPNWGEYGKPWYGLERIQWVGNKAFEMLAVKSRPDGFVVVLTQPLDKDIKLTAADIQAKQWFYHPNEQYGGPKYDEQQLHVDSVEVAPDQRSFRVHIPGLKAGYVVYLRLSDRLRSTEHQKLWTAEAWYTLNAIPDNSDEAKASQNLEDRPGSGFEMLSVKPREDGFVIVMTQPLAKEIQLTAADITVKQWLSQLPGQHEEPTSDAEQLHVSDLMITPDRRSFRVRIPGLKTGYVVYLRLDDRLRSAKNEKLTSAETWYTLGSIPNDIHAFGASRARVAKPAAGDGWHDLFDGKTLKGWRNYGGDENAVRKWTVQDGTLTLVQDGVFPMWDMIKNAVFGSPSTDLVYYPEKFRDFELSLQWKISPGGNSGIFYLVKDETESVTWRTGLEMQVLDNDRHADGKIVKHRAGALYDLVSATPETVRPVGEWNDVLIRVKNNHIEQWLNGVKVVSIERGSEQWNALVAGSKFADMPDYGKSAEGYIALQDHGDLVWYRNIRIRKL
jgi:cytochrome c